MDCGHVRRKRSFNSCDGFTIIDSIVVMAVITILLALLLTAISQIRGNMRQAQCGNNLRQLGIALQLYHGTWRMYPMNYLRPVTSKRERYEHSQVLVALLPYLEQENLFDSLEVSSHRIWSDNKWLVKNAELYKKPLAIYVCPAEGEATLERTDLIYDLDNGQRVARLAISNYRTPAGSNWEMTKFRRADSTGRNKGIFNGLDRGNGFMSRNQIPPNSRWRIDTTRDADIRDGLSTTFAMGESIAQADQHIWWGGHNGMLATCAVPPNWQVKRGLPFLKQRGRSKHPMYFNSLHPGVVQFLFADGHTAAISDQIDISAYRAMGTIDAGEVVSR